jgi:hypothetical protein
MKSALLAVLVMAGVAAAFPSNSAVADDRVVRAAYDEDDDEEEWKCTCTATCDDRSIKVTERTCADDEDMNEAVQEAVAACADEVDGKCEDEASCKCICKPTGKEC